MRTPDAIHNTEAGSRGTRASGARRIKVGLAAVVVFMATFAGLTAAGVSPASASTLNGTATIANPNGLAPLASGGSTTQYTMTLPADAACDGDTATNGYHVFSYLVPEGTNPTAVSFATGLPTDYPDAPTGLFTATGNYYGPANTATNTGQIVSIPGNLEFAPMLTRGLPLGTLLYNGNTSGVWEAGIACANSTGAVTDYWNTEVTFTSSSSDPHGFTWADTPGPCAANSTVGFYSAASTSFTQQSNDYFAATSTGCPDPTITETGPLPSGVTLASSGLLSGSPTQTGSFPIVLSAAIGGGTPVTQNFTLTVPVGVPYPPTGVSATAGSDSASVSFTAPTNNGGASITSYKVTATDTSDSAGSTTATGTTSPINATKLFGGDTYTFTVAAVNSVGTGTSSASSSPVSLATTAPAAPAAPTATPGNRSATVNWAPPNPEGEPITGYVITPYLGATAQTPVDVGDVSTTTVTGLTNGNTYTFTVAAINSVGTGSASPASSPVSLTATAPATPAAPTATAGNQSASVSWVPPNPEGQPITGYVITPYLGATAQTPVDVGNVSTDTVTGLTNGDTYTFTVAATNSVGTGSASPASNSVTPVTVPDTPATPTATSGDQTATVNWTAPGDEGSTITGYVVTPYDNGTAGTVVDVGPSVFSYTFNGLNNGDSYTYTVAATNAVGTGTASAQSAAVVPVTVPDTPATPTATSGDQTATVNWTAPGDEGSTITGYVVTPYDNGTAGTVVDVGPSVFSYTFNGLNNGDSYTYTVAATNAVGTGTASAQSAAVVPVTVPDAPATPTASAGNTQASVSWSPPFDEGSAIVSYTVTPYDNGTAGAPAVVGPSVFSYTFNGVNNGDTYTFTVTATNGVGVGAASPVSNAVVPAAVPDAPATPTATSSAPAQATVNWTAPSDEGSDITGYVVTPYDNGTAGTVVDVGPSVFSYTFNGLNNGDSYTFTVAATNAVGTGIPSSPSNAVVPATVPGAPTIGTATSGNAQASVSFTPPASNGGSNITSYTVTATDSTTPGNGGQTASGSSSPVEVTGLTNGDSYTFTVTATNGVGTGGASAASNAVVPATVPGAPTIGTATAGNAQASVSFTPPASNGGSNITSYTVTATDSTTPGNGGQTASGSSSPVVVTGLTNGDSYTFTVTATNGVGTGGASAASNAVVPVTVPGAPTSVTAIRGNAQATVSFTPPASTGGSNITSYKVTATDSTTPSNGGQTVSGSASPLVVTGLTNGESYTFKVTATNGVGTGVASSPSNAVVPATVPGAPTIGAAIGGNAQASVSFTAPSSNGGSPITLYTVTATDSTTPGNGGETASASNTANPVVVTGLTNGDTYTFTVTATNGVGTGAASSPSDPVVPATVPDPPTIGTATAGNAQASVSFTPPASNGGSAITCTR